MERKGKVYHLTYDDSNLPSHYAFKITADLDRIRREFKQLKNQQRGPSPPTAKSLEKKVTRILAELDDQGRWLSTSKGERLAGQPKIKPGIRFLSSARFAKNVELLSTYLRVLEGENE